MALSLRSLALAAAPLALLAGCGGTGTGDGNEAAPANDVATAPAPANQSAAAAPAPGNAEMVPNETIAANLARSPDHSALVDAIQGAGLTDTFRGPGPYTVFAPTNSAFAALPPETVQTLGSEEGKGQLTSLLTFHVVPGVVAAADLASAVQSAGGTAQLATLGGTNLKVTREGETIVITDPAGNQSRVLQADLVQSNGLVHVVDTVLRPS